MGGKIPGVLPTGAVLSAPGPDHDRLPEPQQSIRSGRKSDFSDHRVSESKKDPDSPAHVGAAGLQPPSDGLQTEPDPGNPLGMCPHTLSAGLYRRPVPV